MATTSLVLSIILTVIILVLTLVTISKGYGYKHTVDPKVENDNHVSEHTREDNNLNNE